MSFKVRSVFGSATFQGAPRIGRRDRGVPPGGTFSAWARREANVLVRNHPDATVIELGLASLSLEATEPVWLSWRGETCLVYRNHEIQPTTKQACALEAGDLIRFGAPRRGVRVWVAAQGGFSGVPGESVRLNVGVGTGEHQVPFDWVPDRIGRAKPTTRYSHEAFLIPGLPEFLKAFGQEFRVSHSSNRVGIRLDGPRFPHRIELPSAPMVPGAVQVTPEGQLIILGPDGPTIGGYPLAGVVVTEDGFPGAQWRPGDTVIFAPTSAEAARFRYAKFDRKAREHLTKLQLLLGAEGIAAEGAQGTHQ